MIEFQIYKKNNELRNLFVFLFKPFIVLRFVAVHLLVYELQIDISFFSFRIVSFFDFVRVCDVNSQFIF